MYIPDNIYCLNKYSLRDYKSKYKNVIFFMGDKGRRIFNDVLLGWELDYEEKKSLTNNDSFILNIKNIKKKN